MPVSANDETGVKPITRQTIDYPAGIPIKKRKFPIIRPPSPPAEEPSLCPEESNSLQKDQSSPSQGSTLSYSSAATSSSGLSDAVKHHEPEEIKGSSGVPNDYGVRANINSINVKVEEPTLTLQPGSVASMNGKDKLVMAENSVNQIIAGKNELKLAPAGSPALNVGFNMPIGQRTEVKVEPEVSALRENNKSLLSLKGQFVPAVTSQIGGKSGQNQDTLVPISLNLSLSRESSSSQCKSDAEWNVDGAHHRANRANWDLNIPMDTWEGSTSDAAVSQTSADGMGIVGRTQHDIHPLIGLAITTEKPRRTENESITSFSLSSMLSSHQYKCNDSLHLQLSPSCINIPIGEPSNTTPKFDSDKVIPITNLLRAVVPSSNFNKASVRPVKSEPVEERIKLDTQGAIPCGVGLLDSAAVKRELVDQGCLETANSSNIRTQKSVDPRSEKSEPALEGNKETVSAVKGMSVKLNEQMVQVPDKHPSAVGTCKTADVAGSFENSSSLTENRHSSPAVLCRNAETACPVMNPSSSAEYRHSSAPETSKTAEIASPVMNSSVSTGLAISGDLLKRSGNFSSTSGGCSEVHQEASDSGRHVTPDVASTSTSIDAKVDSAKVTGSNIDNPKLCESKVADELPIHSHADGVGSVSDEEKINISADIEDSSSDCESDGNQAIDMAIDMELDSDFEDGEVREPLKHTAVEEPVCGQGQLEHIDNIDFNRKSLGTLGLVSDADHTYPNLDEKGLETDTAKIDKKDGEEASDALHSDRCEKEFDNTACLQEPSTVENSPNGASLNGNMVALGIPFDQSGKRDAQDCGETNSEQAAYGGKDTVPVVAQGTDPSLDKDDLVPQSDSALAKSSPNSDNAAKDINSGSHRSRIINLPRSSGSLSPGRNRTFSARQFPSRAGRERFSDVANGEDRIYFRGREEIYVDDTQKFSRERHHDQTPRNSRFNYMRGRGRINNRIDTFRGDRESGRDFASEFHNSQTEFRVPRHKYASSASNADHEYSTYNITQDGGFVGSGRGGRKPLNDEGPFVRRMPSRRRSPGAGRGIHMVRRIPRNMSPNRCVGEDGSELVRLRRNEKFSRGFPDDTIDPMFPRPQPPFEGVGGHFSQGNRNFASVQRRAMHPIRSKSPLSSRTHSPGPWSSPRRRSPDGFSGHPDMTHQRSPFYRIDRMRSPDRRCFPAEVVVRRHDMREMDSGRDHGHPGPGMPNRSPSSHIALRERRFCGIDPQERPDGDDFFGARMHSSRLHELGGDVNGEERRFGERRGPVRSYRTTFNGGEGENYHVNPEDGSRPLRFCPDEDAEYQERGNLIDRDFHRNIKNRPGNVPRRMRNIEEQEANYRHGGQVWHNNEFDEISRVKRKRF
ncbi:hypothetical protein PanWU01x14_043300 [Parasponia andersonii]|uniref:Uncharacterized protein n=1 Tax=Parasponia andersonii TaxID=3476 RepID=A0A2P5DPY9_PARAD|nr:hypothetical protein PanWU01x14_043300 [Parasponia andersonii]